MTITNRKSHLLVVATSGVAAIVALVATVNLSCGSVNNACAQDCADVGDLEARIAALEAQAEAALIREDLTIAVAADRGCAGLEQELAGLDGRQIGSSATVTIELAPGTYACDAKITVRHPDGRHIKIVGTGNGPADVQLTFPAESGGIQVDSGLGLLANLTLVGAGAGDGVHAQFSFVDVENIVVQGFSSGLFIRSGVLRGTNVTTRNNATGALALRAGELALAQAAANENTGAGFSANQGGVVRLVDVEAAGNGAEGFVASLGGDLLATGSVVADGNRDGFHATFGGTLRVDAGNARNSAGHGFVATNHGIMFALSSPSATGNGVNGFAVSSGGFIRTTGTVTASNNTAGDFNVTPVNNSGSGAVITF